MTINEKFLSEYHKACVKESRMRKLLEEKAKKVLEEMAEIEKDDEDFSYLKDVEYGPYNVTGYKVQKRYCSCCSDEYTGFSFPVEYLYRDDWKEKLLEKKAVEERKKEEEKQKRVEEMKRLQEESEIRQWEKLNEKYGKNKGEIQ